MGRGVIDLEGEVDGARFETELVVLEAEEFLRLREVKLLSVPVPVLPLDVRSLPRSGVGVTQLSSRCN